jgi:hypothetical protein
LFCASDEAFIPYDHPHNKAERECYKFAKNPSMYGYINLPTGCPTKISRSDLSASITAGSPYTASATKASSVRVKHVKTSTRGKYNKNDEGGARHAWVSSMSLNGDRKEAFGAMMKANPTASIPWTTLNNALIAAKKKGE